MKDIVLLTVRDLAKRWNKDERSIRNYVADGTITTCKGVPGVMFHPDYIAKLEGIEVERFSPIERRRMEKEIKKLKEVIQVQNEKLNKMAILGTETVNLLQNFYGTSL